MAAKKPKHPNANVLVKHALEDGSEKHSKLNHFANLPNSLTITNIVQHDNCDEYFVTIQSPPKRICPSAVLITA